MGLLTVEEVAERLRVGKNVAYETVNKPGFPKIKVGRQIRVPEKLLEEWIVKQASAGSVKKDVDSTLILLQKKA